MFQDPNVYIDGTISRPAAAAIGAGLAAVVNSSNQIALATVGGPMDGVTDNEVTALAAGALGALGDVTIKIPGHGQVSALAGGTCTAGLEATFNSLGKFLNATFGSRVVGRFTTSGTSGDEVGLIPYPPGSQTNFGAERAAVLALSGATIHAASGGVVAWQNPEGTGIVITRVVLDVTTPATDAGGVTFDVGVTGTSATTSSDTLLDGVDVHTAAAVFDSMDPSLDSGANAHAQKLAAGKWITVDEKTGDATGLVGNLYIFYVIQ